MSIKSVALAVFGSVRTVQHYAALVPVIAKAAAHDVRDAWHESATPKNA